MQSSTLNILTIGMDSSRRLTLQRLLQQVERWTYHFVHATELSAVQPELERAKPSLVFIEDATGVNWEKHVADVRAAKYRAAVIMVSRQELRTEPRRLVRAGIEDCLDIDTLSITSLERSVTLALDRQERALRDRHRLLRVEKAYRELRTKLDQVGGFYRQLANEMQAPLTTAQSFVGMLLSGRDGPLTDLQQQHTVQVRQHMEKVGGYIEYILDSSRINAGALELWQETTTIRDIAERALTEVGPAAANARVQVELAPGADVPDVWCDRNRILQVLVGLTEHAVANCEAGDRVELIISTSREQDGVQVTVRDNGRGMEASRLRAKFERYDHGDAEVDGSMRLAMGLHVARQLIELHGSTVKAMSEPGRGTIISFTLPLARREEVVETRVEGGQRAKVLIVEDDEMQLQSLILSVRSAGFDVCSAFDAATGVMAATKERPDLLLLDISMPSGGGFAVAVACRSSASTKNVPIIFLSSNNDAESLRQARDCGAYAFLEKPAKIGQLVKTIQAALAAD